GSAGALLTSPDPEPAPSVSPRHVVTLSDPWLRSRLKAVDGRVSVAQRRKPERSGSHEGAPGTMRANSSALRFDSNAIITTTGDWGTDGPSHCWLNGMTMYRAFVAATDITDTQPATDTKHEGRSPCPAAVSGSKPVPCSSPGWALPRQLWPA